MSDHAPQLYDADARWRVIMKRRDLSAVLLLGGSAVLGGKSGAQESRPGYFPRMPNEGDVDAAYPPGNVLRYRADPGGVRNSSAAFQSALDLNGSVFVPRGRYRIRHVSLDASGRAIRGESRYETVLEPWVDSGTPRGAPMFHFKSRAKSTSYGHLFENLAFHFFAAGQREESITNAVGIDLGAVNNTIVRGCRFQGRQSSGTNGIGVIFASPRSRGSYANAVVDCDFSYCETGVRFDAGANNNLIVGGEICNCGVGVDAAPPTGERLDTPRIYGTRIENCNVGLKERAKQGMYFGIRFEDNRHADVEFLAGSLQPHFFGGHTASSKTPFLNPQLASGLVCLAPDMFLNSFPGLTVLGPERSDAELIPAGANDMAAYVRGGHLVLDNSQWLAARDAQKQGLVLALRVNSSNSVELGTDRKVDLGGTGNADRARISKPSFAYSGSAPRGAIVDKFPVYDATGVLVGYVPVYAS